MTSENLTVVIVGAGFCGLTAAIECKLNGLTPILLDAYPTSRYQGDVLDFMHNEGRHINAWDNGRVGEKLLKTGVHTAKTFDYYSSTGELLCPSRGSSATSTTTRSMPVTEDNSTRLSPTTLSPSASTCVSALNTLLSIKGWP